MPDSVPAGSLDCATLGRLYEDGGVAPVAVVSDLFPRLAAYPDPAVWIHRLSPDEILTQAHAVQQRRAAGERLPLFGLPFAVKDNIDVLGKTTTAACPAFAYVARQTAPVVQRLLDAGAILIGKTNLDQFACGLAGDRSPYGVCRNVFDSNFISGGSSSGSAVAVAAGLVSFALGTDTAGSGRVPAGCNNIVGLKPTPGVLSTEGVVPACASVDCVSILALTVTDALAVWEAARTPDTSDQAEHPPESQRLSFAVPREEDLEFFGDSDQKQLFEEAIRRLEQLGWRQVRVDFRPFREVAALLYEGPWVAERLAGVDEFLTKHAVDVHPVTRSVLEGGRRYTGVEVFKALARLRRLREVCLKTFAGADVLVVPTMPTIPTRAEAQADSRGWSRRLGTYTNFANLLGLAGLVLPSGFTPHGLPASITLLAPGGSDRRLCALGQPWQRRLNLPLGATGKHLSAVSPPTPTLPRQGGGSKNAPPRQGGGRKNAPPRQGGGRKNAPPRQGGGSKQFLPPPWRGRVGVGGGHVRLAVAGAHLRGQPLHPALLRTGAHFVRACRTAERYRFFAFLDVDPPRPGLLRVEDQPAAVEVEIYDLPLAGFGMLVASVLPPLAIGTVELQDGEFVKGFLCESAAAARARDITDFGGWIGFLTSVSPTAKG